MAFDLDPQLQGDGMGQEGHSLPTPANAVRWPGLQH